jgi:hypothetical protein
VLAGKKSVHVWNILKQQACHAGCKSIIFKKNNSIDRNKGCREKRKKVRGRFFVENTTKMKVKEQKCRTFARRF